MPRPAEERPRRTLASARRTTGAIALGLLALAIAQVGAVYAELPGAALLSWYLLYAIGLLAVAAVVGRLVRAGRRLVGSA